MFDIRKQQVFIGIHILMRTFIPVPIHILHGTY